MTEQWAAAKNKATINGIKSRDESPHANSSLRMVSPSVGDASHHFFSVPLLDQQFLHCFVHLLEIWTGSHSLAGRAEREASEFFSIPFLKHDSAKEYHALHQNSYQSLSITHKRTFSRTQTVGFKLALELRDRSLALGMHQFAAYKSVCSPEKTKWDSPAAATTLQALQGRSRGV
jgi:hypothetical protein